MDEFELFQSALDIDDPEARRSFLESACAEDEELLGRVESLLASHDGESMFLQTPVAAQLGSHVGDGTAATIYAANGSTNDEDDDAAVSDSTGPDLMSQNRIDPDDEISLSYLQPSKKPGSLGRLAHYEILEVIGQGAFGTVLRSFDDKLQRVVAIKVLAPELASTSPARKRFLREAQASAAIRHEHVVRVYSVEEKPLPYLVMEYIPGVTLQQRLDERGPLDVPTVVSMGRQIADGLAAAHGQELIHRDIKPGNILLETGVHDRVKITDFGLARAADDASLTQSGVIAGTPMYMAPEQALGKQLDQRADLFSFGSVLYQMVSGRPPYRAASTLAVLKRVAEDTPRPIREIIPETPQWLCDIITKLHAKNPDERYQSAREVADVLASCESQLKTHSGLKDFSLIPRSKKQPAGWWKWVAVAVLVCPLLAVGLYVLSRQAARPQVAENETTQPPITNSPKRETAPSPIPASPRFPPGSSADMLTSADYEWTEPENLGPNVNSDSIEADPHLSADGKSLYFTSNRGGGWNIWLSSRNSVDEPWSEAQRLPEPVNSEGVDAGHPNLSSDGLELFFHSHRHLGYITDIWTATRDSIDDNWQTPIRLGVNVNTDEYGDEHPTLSPDDLSLIFISFRSGESTLWTSRRESRDSEWLPAVPLEMPLNDNVHIPALAHDGLSLVFVKWGDPYDGGLAVSGRISLTAPWSTPQTLNLPHGRHCTLSADARSIIFSSEEVLDENGCTDLWMSRRVRKTDVGFGPAVTCKDRPSRT